MREQEEEEKEKDKDDDEEDDDREDDEDAEKQEAFLPLRQRVPRELRAVGGGGHRGHGRGRSQWRSASRGGSGLWSVLSRMGRSTACASRPASRMWPTLHPASRNNSSISERKAEKTTRGKTAKTSERTSCCTGSPMNHRKNRKCGT